MKKMTLFVAIADEVSSAL